MSDIDLGAAQLIAFDTYDASGALANVTGVTLTITLPDGTPATPAVTNPPAVTGKYRLTYLPAAIGHYEWTAVTTAANEAWSDSFNVRAWRSILGLDDARDFLDLRDTSRDPVLRSVLAGITRRIERRIGTCVIRAITGEFIPGTVCDAIRLPSGPPLSAVAVTSVTSTRPGGPSWAAADLTADPGTWMTWPVDGSPFTGGPWLAAYAAGRSVFPADVIEGAKAALYDVWAVQRGVSADQQEPSMDEVSAYELAPPPGWQLPARVTQMLDGETIPGFA